MTNQHQEKNARLLVSGGAAEMLLEGEFNAETLYQRVTALLSDRRRLAEMGGHMRRLGVPDATERIAELILSYVKKRA